MLHAGLDLSRKRLDFCLLDESGERIEVGATPPDADGLQDKNVPRLWCGVAPKREEERR
jgi:hypothetical protein